MQQDTLALLKAYFAAPETYWPEQKQFQASKARTTWQRWSDAMAASGDWLAEVARTVEANSRLSTLYVSGLGGSGSHWLGAMLADCQPSVICGEVYFPDAIVARLESCGRAEARSLVLTYQLLHSHPQALGKAATARFLINTAAGIHRADRYRSWEPDAAVIYLARDPRDQVMSTTFRKAAFRDRVFADLSDEEYLAVRIHTSVRSYEHVIALQMPPTATVKYEDLRTRAADALGDIFAALRLPVAPEVLQRAADDHDAGRIRQGLSDKTRSNLDRGGKAQGWQRDADAVLAVRFHVHLQDAIFGLGYAIPDPWAAAVAATPQVPPAAPPSGTYVVGLRDGDWRKIEGAGGSFDATALRVLRLHVVTAPDIEWINRTGVRIVSLAVNAKLAKLDFARLPPLQAIDTLDISGLALPDKALAWLGRSRIATLRANGTTIGDRPVAEALAAGRLPSSPRLLADPAMKA
jgi:hypothetical protein